MMKQDLSIWQFGGFALTSLGGTLLHFLYEWTGESILVAPFSGVNESTWEHMKLLFWPLLFFALIQRLFFKDCENFWYIKLCGISTGLILIPVLFYTLNGAFSKTPDWINIGIFFVSTAASFLLETRLFKKDVGHRNANLPSFILLLSLAVLFVVFTFFTPPIPLFEDPLTGTYGISKNR